MMKAYSKMTSLYGAFAVLAFQVLINAALSDMNWWHHVFHLMGMTANDMFVNYGQALTSCGVGLGVVLILGLGRKADIDPRPSRWRAKGLLFVAIALSFLTLLPAIGARWDGFVSSGFFLLTCGYLLLLAIGEELISRGVIQTLLMPYGHDQANLASTVMFTLMHVPAWIRSAYDPLTVVLSIVTVTSHGYVFAILRTNTKALLPIALIHGMWNALGELSKVCYGPGCEAWAQRPVILQVVLWLVSPLACAVLSVIVFRDAKHRRANARDQ